MGIDRLYYWTAALGLASFCCLSTWGPFDGKFHRPKNQYVKQRKKSNVAASAAAEKAEKLASEVGLDGVADRASAKKRKYERGARDERDDEPAARPSTKQDRRRSRAQTPGPARRHKHGHGDDTTVFHSSTYDSSDSSRSSEKRASQQRSSRVKPTPYSGYVPEAYVLGTPVPGSPLEPVNTQHRHSAHQKPSDFAKSDHKTGKAHRDGDYETYKYLYGGYDDQMHAPFEGAA